MNTEAEAYSHLENLESRRLAREAHDEWARKKGDTEGIIFCCEFPLGPRDATRDYWGLQQKENAR